MNALEGLRLALGQIRAHKLKSFFSLLGIVIGVMFLIGVITILEGMNRYVHDDFAGSLFGVNTFSVVRSARIQTGERSAERRRREARRPYLTLHDVEVVRRAVPDARSFAWESDTYFSEVRHADRRRRNIRLIGGSVRYPEVRGWRVAEGRGLSSLDERRGLPVAVVGPEITDKLFPAGETLGKEIRLGAHRFRIVGVFERRGGLTGNLWDAAVLIPYSTYSKTVSDHPGRVGSIHVKVDAASEMEPTMARVEAALRTDRELRPSEENDFDLETSSELLSAWNQINRVLLTALPGLVAISLLVGGIVIMNIMLVSVSQRTREIGIRKALGASERDIMLQFLAESSVLALVGAAIGVGLGAGLARGVEALTPLPASTPLWAVVVAVALGGIVGIVSGLYPARRAARLDPIDALGYE